MLFVNSDSCLQPYNGICKFDPQKPGEYQIKNISHFTGFDLVDSISHTKGTLQKKIDIHIPLYITEY